MDQVSAPISLQTFNFEQMIIVTGENSSIWREIGSKYENDDVVYYDIINNKFRTNPLEVTEKLKAGNTVYILHFASATPNNTSIDSHNYFYDKNYVNIKELIFKVVECGVIKLKIVNISTSAIFDRTTPSSMLTLKSKKISDGDAYGYSKLMLLNWFNEIADEKIKVINIIVPVLLGRYTGGNFLTRLIDAAHFKRIPNVSFIESKFNAMVSVRSLAWLIDQYFEIPFQNTKTIINILGCSTGEIEIIKILEILKLRRYEVILNNFPPKRISTHSVLASFPRYSCDVLTEIRHYEKIRRISC